MSEQHDSVTDRVLRALFAHDNDLQGEWTSLWELKTTMVAHGRIEYHELQEALHQLRQEDKIEVGDQQYRIRDGVTRPKYPGEQ